MSTESNDAYLVFETGGAKLVAGVAGPGGRLIETEKIYREPADRARKSFARLTELGRALFEKRQTDGARFRAVGFGFGGTVYREARKPHRCLHEQGWEELDVAAALEKEFGIPVFIENDCKLAALAEAHFGAGKGCHTVFYVTLGTGVGGGIVRGGRIQAFSDIGEAEIGHVVVEPEGLPCWCGGRGCVESVCSASRPRSSSAQPDIWRKRLPPRST